MNRICVFDLDGSIWAENSHVSVVESYLGKRKYSGLLGRVKAKLDFSATMKALNADYVRIPSAAVQKFSPHYREEALTLLKQFQEDGYVCFMVSNAPTEIIQIAERKLQIKGYHAAIRDKLNVLKTIYSTWEELVVITDNLSDADLLAVADRAVVFVSKRTKMRFQQLILPKDTLFIQK